MIVSLVLVALSAAPPLTLSQPPAAQCERCVLVAQPDAPTASPSTFTAPEITGTDRELHQRILALNQEARGIDTNWPGGLVALGISGFVASPVGVDLLLLGIFLPDEVPLFVAVLGGALIVVGLVAVITAWVVGSAIAAGQRRRREALIRQRELVEEELRFRRSTPQPQPSVLGPDPVRPLVMVAEF